jgi:hypothetical protein
MVDSTPDKNFTICAAQEQFAAYPAVGPTTGLAPPQFGAATMGGAEDGRSAFFYSLWHGGVKGNSGNSQQVPKIGALELPQLPWYIRKFARLVTNPGAFPHSLPVTVARLGDLVSIVAVPFEVTTLAGSRLRSRLLPSQRSRAVLLVGLANEYLSYLATPEEYLAQEYEGASTVFGRSQATVVEHLVSIVANRLQSCAAPDPQPVTVPATKYPLGIPPIIPLGPQLFDQRRNLVEEGLEPFIPDSTGRLRFDYPRFEWDESSIPDFTAQDREVTIYESTGAGWRPVCVNGVREDDAGLNLLTVLTEARGSLRNWSAIWLFPHRPHSDGQYFFRVRTAKQEDQCSKPFYLPSPSGYPASPLAPAACPEPMPDTCSN